AVRRPLACWRSMACSPPPRAIRARSSTRRLTASSQPAAAPALASAPTDRAPPLTCTSRRTGATRPSPAPHGEHDQQAAAGVPERVRLALPQRHEASLAHALRGVADPDERLALQHLVDDRSARPPLPRLAGLEADELAGQAALLEQPTDLHLREGETAGVGDVDGLHALTASSGTARTRRVTACPACAGRLACG